MAFVANPVNGPEGAPRLGPESRRALVLMATEPTQDPRTAWMAEGLSAEFEVCELGIQPVAADPADASFERLPGRRTRVRVGRQRCEWAAISDGTAERLVGIRELARLHGLAELPAEVLERTVGAHDATGEDLQRFGDYLRYLLHSNSALIDAGRRIGQFDCVVATDLDALPAGLVLAEECDAALVYDSHEFWPYSIPVFRDWEVEFWFNLDRRLASLPDLCVTVSPQLADLMSQQYGYEFLPLPNCVSKNSVAPVDVELSLRRREAREVTDFIFLGGFGPGRGIEDLISAWRYVGKRARLLLQGPDCEFKAQMVELARRESLLDNGVGFPRPVETDELVNAAREADVGIIPYAPISINNRYCCPNKLSQYMAAGLPIVCNETEFVKSVVVGNEIGICVDFGDHRALARAIDEFAVSRQKIAEMSRRSHRLFNEKFNWETVSRDLYSRIDENVRRKPARRRADLDFSWIAQGRGACAGAAAALQGGASISADAEIKRLNSELDHVNETYTAEIARLNAEITELNETYAPEIARLNEVYPAEIARLNDEIARLNTANGRLNEAPRRREFSNAWYRKLLAPHSAVICNLLCDRSGRAALREALLKRSVGRGLLVQLARVLSARRLARRCGGALVGKLAGCMFELSAGGGPSPGAGDAVTPSGAELVTALSGGRTARCVLALATPVSSRSVLLSQGRYELPDLLRWLAARPERAVRLLAAPRRPERGAGRSRH